MKNIWNESDNANVPECVGRLIAGRAYSENAVGLSGARATRSVKGLVKSSGMGGFGYSSSSLSPMNLIFAVLFICAILALGVHPSNSCRA